MAEMVKNLIAGTWVETGHGKTFEDRSPADTERVIGVFPMASGDDVERAIAAAKEAFPRWSRVSAIRRGELLQRAAEILRGRAEEIARLESMEMGKPIGEARGEVQAAIAFLDYYAGFGYRLAGETLPSVRSGVRLMTLREPVGVVVAITPWNFPISIPVKKTATALITGNTVVLKPASHSPAVAVKIAEALVEAGIPDGVINLITGSGSEISDALLQSKDVAAVSFTGSTEVGLGISLACAGRDVRVQAEMGGKNATVVLDDADLGSAVDAVVNAAFTSAGQKCTATSRVILQDSIYDRFMKLFEQRVNGLKVGDPLDEGTFMGPVVGEKEMRTILGYIESAKSEGARLLLGGQRLEDGALKKGFYVAPTIFADVDPDMTIAQEEIFGPVVAVFRVKTLDQALELTNGTRYGLAAALFTSNLKHAERFMAEAEVGCVAINESTAGWEVQAPFGGVKDSGLGIIKEQGSESITFCTRLKSVVVRG